MQTVLITGAGGPAGRATAAFFREAGWRIIPTDIVPVGGLDIRIVPPGGDPEFDGAILDLIVREEPDLVVPTVSEELPRVARLACAIRGLGAKIFISRPDAVDAANDKYVTASLLARDGIAVPRTLAAAGATDAPSAGASLGYPFLAKPRVGRGGRGVNVIVSSAEAARERRPDAVYQEFMPGEEFDVNLFAHPAGYARALVVLHKTGLRNGLTGNADGVRRVADPAVGELALSAVRALGLEGPVDIDIRRDRAGRPRILEINARVGANALAAREVLEQFTLLTPERTIHDASPRSARS